MNKKLDETLPRMYAELHAQGAFQGESWRVHLPAFHRFNGSGNNSPVLDFGCGPRGGLAAEFPGHTPYVVIPYDPYVPQHAGDPWGQPFRTFFSADVFEHLPIHQLTSLLLRLRKRPALKRLFIALSTRPANKILPNGLNAHLTVQPAVWWEGFLQGAFAGHFDLKLATADLVTGVAVFGMERPSEREQ